MNDCLALEGYASLFGVPDLSGDVVHAGAFGTHGRALRDIPLLLEHDLRLKAGLWTELLEDGRGLYVRGRIIAGLPGASMARRRLQAGVDGLSIGFRTESARARQPRGRDLYQLHLFEVSLVKRPMAPLARLIRSTLKGPAQ